MNLPIVPVLAILLIFGVPYLVIYLQGKRLAAIELELRRLTDHVDGSLNKNSAN